MINKNIMKGIAIFIVISALINFSSFSQCITELGIWSNNANFTIEYYQNRVITSTTSGIEFIDVTSSSAPFPSGSLGNPSNFPLAIEVEDDYAYFGGGMTGYFMISDISNINFPNQIGITYNISGTAYDIAIKGNYAFMPTNSDTLYSIDIIDKTTPVVVDKIDLGSSPKGVVVNGNYAFVGTNLGLKVVDISDPTNMSIITSFGGGYEDIAADFANNRIFVSNTGSGFDVIDISDPVNPVGLFQGAGASSSGKLVFKNNYIFQLGGGINLFEVTLSAATYICTYNATFNGQINSVTIKDSVFYVSTVNALHVLSIGNGTSGVDTFNNALQIDLTPNPTNEVIKLSNLADFSSLTILDYTGKIVYKSNLNNDTSVIINIGHLQKGAYVVEVQNSMGNQFLKFIKN